MQMDQPSCCQPLAQMANYLDSTAMDHLCAAVVSTLLIPAASS